MTYRKKQEQQQVEFKAGEKVILDQLAEAEATYKSSQLALHRAKMEWINAETNLINAKLEMERVQETLRVYRSKTIKFVPELRDLDIERFREKFPELCEMAAERDRNKP